MNMLFERFISRERNEPPDIDVDFEHQRREEVIQYIYAQVRPRARRARRDGDQLPHASALRDVGKALGLPLDEVDRAGRRRFTLLGPEAASRARRHRLLLELAGTLRGFPRHLSQHVGGFVISRGPLAELVPVENAAMPERTRDPVGQGRPRGAGAAQGRRAGARHAVGDPPGAWMFIGMTMHEVPRARIRRSTHMIQKADTIGVFQIESRAQMTMLPRLQPASSTTW